MSNIDLFFSEDPAIFASRYLEYLSGILKAINTAQVGNFIKILLDARDRGSAIYFIGNGGSAATASHFANDIAIGTNSKLKPFRAFSLVDNISIMTAIANDYGYDEVFSRQLQVYGKAGDLIVGISASGNSENIIKAFECARNMEIRSIAITAFDGGRMRAIADEGIHIPTGQKEYGPAEDAHMILDHLIGAYLMRIVNSFK